MLCTRQIRLLLSAFMPLVGTSAKVGQSDACSMLTSDYEGSPVPPFTCQLGPNTPYPISLIGADQRRSCKNLLCRVRARLENTKCHASFCRHYCRIVVSKGVLVILQFSIGPDAYERTEAQPQSPLGPVYLPTLLTYLCDQWADDNTIALS